MRIAIDLRSLSSGSISGVENYCLNLLENLLPMDKQNTYALFYNVFKKVNADEFHFINSKIKKTRIPNKILNLSFKTRVLKLENLTGPVDCLFMPNLNQINIGPDVKLAITIHDLSPIVTPQYYNLKRKLWHKFINYEKIIARANLLFAVSEHTKLDLVRLFHVPENKITVVYPGVDLKVFYPETDVQKLRAVRNKYSLPGNYILFLNTIEPRKNLDNLLKAFELLPLPVNLVIAGKKGWKYRTIFKKIKMSGKAKQIKYLNYVEEKDKPAIINLARALVYPSFYEGFGFQPLEAAACGVPVIASQITAIPEVLGQACILINPYDISQIVRSLTTVLEDPILVKSLTLKARQQASKFSWQSTAQATLKGLQSLAL